MKKLPTMIAMTSLAVSLCDAGITVVKNNTTVSITQVSGTNDYTVIITQIGDPNEELFPGGPLRGPATVLLNSDGINDRIVEIEILEKVNLLNQHIKLDIYGVDAGGVPDELLFSPLAAFVDVTEHTAVELEIGIIRMDGDLGQPSSQGAHGDMVFFEAERIDIKGSWYADVLVDDGIAAPTDNFVVAFFQGTAAEGGFEYQNGRIPFFQSPNSLSDFHGTITEPFYIRTSDEAEIISARAAIEVDFDVNQVNQVEFGEDFISATPIHWVTMGGLQDSQGRAGGLNVVRDYDVVLTLDDPLAEHGFMNPLKPTDYSIGRTMLTGSEFNLPNDGLTTQVIINKENGSGEWLGTVNVGPSITLGPILSPLVHTSYYSELSSELGGGAVGLAPFNFHQRETAPPPNESMDCNPYQKEVRALLTGEPLDSAVISHYGPVYVDGVEPFFRVEFLPDLEVNPIWVDRTDLFEVDLSSTGQDEASATRSVTITKTLDNKKGFKAPGTWRIRPIPGKLKCADVAGNPNALYASSVVSGDLGSMGIFSWYEFRVVLETSSGGSLLLNTGNGPQASDLAEWLIHPFETNADGETDSQDFIDMANQYTGE